MKQFHVKIDKYANMFINVFMRCIHHHAKSVQSDKKCWLMSVSLCVPRICSQGHSRVSYRLQTEQQQLKELWLLYSQTDQWSCDIIKQSNSLAQSLTDFG